jgi:hypothetical protein
MGEKTLRSNNEYCVIAATSSSASLTASLTANVSTRLCPPTFQATANPNANATAATGSIANNGVGGGNIMTIWTKNNNQQLYWQLQLQQQHLQLAVTERSSSKWKKRELCTAVAQQQWLNHDDGVGGGILLLGPKKQS